MVILKLDKGVIEKLIKKGKISKDEFKNLTGKELTLEIKDREFVIELHKEKFQKLVEMADVNGSFGLWFELNQNNSKKLKKLV